MRSGATRKAILGDTCDRCSRYLHRGVKRHEYVLHGIRSMPKLCQRCRNEVASNQERDPASEPEGTDA